ncbi:DUF2244 domain-containing protein [Roseovarius salis]|uniref:DUF2244 domain-containing protein n=1 Tax=Roseovarius salis TaxID=3376063 RepID=UPI0037C7DCE5
MPYEWSESDTVTGVERRLCAWPHRSLPRRGFAAFILATFTLITIPLYPLLGTVVLWGLLPFLLLAVGGIWWGLERSYRDGELREELTIDPEHVHLRRTDPRGAVREWDCNSYWATAQIHATGGPVPHYLTLRGKGREVELGAFLSEDERKTLFAEVSEALAMAARPGPAV